MTFLEKLKKMMPDKADRELEEIMCLCCPADLELEKESPKNCLLREAAAPLEVCITCWNRQMEGGT